MMRWRGWVMSAIAALLLVVPLVLAPRALAFDTRTGEQVVVRAGEVIDDDLYIAAQEVRIDGTVRGDLIVAAQIVTINGTIEGDVIAAAQSVTVNGTVRDSVRVAAQAVLLEGRGRIGKDLLVATYSLESRPESTVGRDIAVGTYQSLLAGAVTRNVKGGMVALEIRGSIGGSVDVAVGSDTDGAGQTFGTPPPNIGIPLVRPGITLSEAARIDGRLTYAAARELPIRGQVRGGITWTPVEIEKEETPSAVSLVVEHVRRLVVLAIVGVLLILAAPRWTRRLAETIEARPLPSLGWGAVGWLSAFATGIGLMIGTIVLGGVFGLMTLSSLAGLIVVIGLLGEGVLAVGMVALGMFVAQALFSYVGGHWILQRIRPTPIAPPIVALLLGLPLYVVLTAIPVLGGLVGLLAAVVALGAMWLWVGERGRSTPLLATPEASMA